MSLLKKVLDFFRPMSTQERIESYLAKSVDLVDLERRMKEMDRRFI